jgi:transcriptional regulator with XRE-family HTH domain
MARELTVTESFAKNLRRHCDKQPSIAAICAATKINRQQFNKYLSGKVLPGSLKLRKICEYLGVSEAELFRTRKSSAKSRMADATSHTGLDDYRSSLLGVLPFAKENIDFKNTGLPDGYYYSHFPVPNQTGTLMRSLVWIYSKEGRQHFVRVTSEIGRSNQSATRIRGRHSGIVFSNHREIFLMAFSRYGIGHLTLSVFQKPTFPSSGNVLKGLTLTRNGERIFSMWTVLAPIPSDTSVRDMLRGVGAMTSDNPAIDMGVRSMFPDKPYL